VTVIFGHILVIGQQESAVNFWGTVYFGHWWYFDGKYQSSLIPPCNALCVI